MIAEKLDLSLSILSGLGVEASEVFLLSSRTGRVQVEDGKTIKATRDFRHGAAIRVLDGGRAGFSFTSDLCDRGLIRAAREAVSAAKIATPDSDACMPSGAASCEPLDLFDPQLDKIAFEEKVEAAAAAETAAKSVDPRIGKFRETSFRETMVEAAIANTLGRRGSYTASMFVLTTSPTAVEGADRQIGWASGWARRFRDLDPRKVGEEAAAGCVTLVDDGRTPAGSASSPFDAEGTPAGRTPLIDAGKLVGFFHTMLSAKRLGARPTGNSSRSSFTSPPACSATNFHILPGAASPEDVMRAAGSGIYVTEMLGLHTIDPVSGNFSVGASGNLLHKGKMGKPVRGIAVAGNLKDLLGSIRMVGSDLRFFPGGEAGSTTLLEGVSLSC